MNFDHRELLFMEEKNYSSWSLEETGEFLAYKVREFDTDTDIVKSDVKKSLLFIFPFMFGFIVGWCHLELAT